MAHRLGLRLRIFLFFCLMGLGGSAVVLLGLWAGYARTGGADPLDAFVIAALVSVLGLLALSVGVWLLFDENVARPIERLAAQLRSRAHAGVETDLDLHAARYLGDLAPAAAAMAGQLSASALDTAGAIAAETARLEAEKARLASLLTEVPLATILLSPAHQIVLYDGQAAGMLAQVAHPRLNASLFDYLERGAVEAAYARLVRTGREVSLTAAGADGAQRYSARMKPLGDAPGYLLILDDSTATLAPEAARPLVYDFALLDQPEHAGMEARRLQDLTYVVFDTETTGLLPHKDDIVQIGAVRVLRGRIVPGEEIDQLVDPDRPIPPASTRVHGISDAMVAGAPGLDPVARSFHRFASGAVIVAHNAPFDMAFLRRQAQQSGLVWDHPILDTVLLSAVLFGASESHTLDAICARLGIAIPEDRRHTALGDARATAQVLCRMLPMLEARGLATLGAVLEETRRHGRLLEDLN
ncbi:3'-5' exonuclease [Pseudodonghicola flavimaris]|uniref:DNA-directed DNA polymerase n=1 Tax=Pseudodonghicola flavimaris TaxID=3050036 RepID=A0ABT7F531_9RHOB|nr:exonuclease domain-containing protein [Pseudodonghicola flavimaris]MDK3019692.1 exonuclease domain-containing protein [Pseudodonghicola flavimaris]